ncbi:Scarecrow-like transcription factor PAT1 [Sesamum angolense]|uniref:Scarecrow-like transcription factor PAT1 n=1 Tax=Sesamum angolense TaxID=2727404 RepID=A0AAE1W5A7_9LAMI|nr:Scarecrow-like transcription factor PAT1 [Sesamum angolense]
MTSQNHDNIGGSGRFVRQSLEELESYFLDASYNPDHYISCDGESQGMQFPAQTYEQHCRVDSSIASGSYSFYNSPSAVSFSSNGSSSTQPDCVSDTNNSIYDTCLSVSRACSLDCENDLENKLGELRPLQPILGPDSRVVGAGCQFSVEPQLSKEAMEIIQRKNLKEMLVACAKSVADNDLFTSELFMSELRLMVSVCGEPLQRLGAYMLEGLVARLASSGSSIYKALRCKEPTSPELLSYMHLLYEICPYFKFGYLSANGAIAEAMKNETRIHIIDFQIAQGSQWITLIQALATRPGGPPQMRITGVDDPVSAYARGGGLEIVGQRLSGLAKSCGVPFEFHGLAISGCDLETLRITDRLLRMVKNLSPKVVTLVEQESNTNTAPFVLRFIETLEYYLAIFESIDVALSRENKERINVEQHCLARDIVNVIACEGPERVERHELLEKWRRRFAMAGFAPFPLSSFVNSTIKNLLKNYSGSYRLVEGDGCLYLGWMNRTLVASCAWI